MGRYVLSGLLNIGALIVLFVASFWNSTVPLRDLSSAWAIAREATPRSTESAAMPIPVPTPAPQSPSVAELSAEPARAAADNDRVTMAIVEPRSPEPEPPSPDETKAVVTTHPPTGSVGEGVRTNAGRHTRTAMSQLQSTAALTAAPVPKGSGTGHHRRHHHTHGSPVRNDVPVLSDRHDSPEPPRDTFFAAPNPNGGANS
jgi:hypothetical protein